METLPVPRYSVLPLVSLCSSLLAGSLSSGTALKLGVLGETHQAGELLAASARYIQIYPGISRYIQVYQGTFVRYIAGNLSSLGGDEAGDWMEAARGSPRLTAGIVEALRLGQRSSLAADLCPEVARRYRDRGSLPFLLQHLFVMNIPAGPSNSALSLLLGALTASSECPDRRGLTLSSPCSGWGRRGKPSPSFWWGWGSTPSPRGAARRG